MKKVINRSLAILLACLLVLGGAPIEALSGLNLHWPNLGFHGLSGLFEIKANATDTSGTCGDNMTWEYDESTATLTISGTGTMQSYSTGSYDGTTVTTAPWQPYYKTMKTLVIGDNVSTIGGHAFYRCTGLTSVIIGNKASRIRSYAFAYCSGLTDVNVGNTMSVIEDFSFAYCTGLTSVYIPASASSIDGYAFHCCEKLEAITVDENNTTYASDDSGALYILFYKKKIRLHQYPIGNTQTVYTIPDTVTGIDSFAFQGCTHLKRVIIPNSVTSIGQQSFYKCSGLESVVIGNSINKIGSTSFNSCTKLRDIYYYGTVASWNSIEIASGNTSISTATRHYFTEVAEQVASCGADGKTAYSYWSNTNPIEYVEEPTIIPKTGQHMPSEPIIENESAATCGMNGSYDSVICCSVCGTELSRQTVIVPATGQHTTGPSVVENEVAATCVAEGYYDSVEYCSVCGEELSRETITIPATEQHMPGSPVIENSVLATCAAEGYYDSVEYCSVCHAELGRQTIIVPATGQHKASDAVTENEIAATCAQDGHYDSVIYCSVCRTELNRSTITIPATGHTASPPVYENENLPTCITQGTFDSVVYCSVCHEEISRETITVPATGQHTPDVAVTENLLAATCTQKGHYDTVVYCTVCGEEISRQTIAVPTIEHSFSNYLANGDATCTQDGTKTAQCDYCDATNTIVDEGTAFGHSFINYVSDNNATLTEDGTKTAKCVRCDAEDTIPDRGTSILTYVIRNNTVEITKCKPSVNGAVVIPEMINGCPVTTIGEEAFYNCTGMTDVTIPESVRSIGNSAFSHCTALTSIDIPDGVTDIEDYAFSDCYNVAGITIADSVQNIGRNVFVNCTAWYAGLADGPVVVDGYLLDVKGSLPENAELTFSDVRVVATNALRNQTGLKKVLFGEAVARISKGAFSGCYGLTVIELSDHVVFIHDEAFSGCDGLTITGYYNEYVKSFAESKSFIYLPYTVTLSLNPTDGQIDTPTVSIIAKKTLGDTILPEPVCATMAFGGWYADESCTTVVSADSTFDEDATIYASWLNVSSISIKAMPEKTQFVIGDQLDATGLVLTASFPNGTTKDIDAGYTCTPNQLSKQGKYRIKVTFAGTYAYYYVTVQEAENMTLAVKTMPNKLHYQPNERFDSTGMVLILDYGNGITQRITNGFEVDYDFSTAGTKNVTISYTAGNTVLTTDIYVEVSEAVNEIYADAVSVMNRVISVPVCISQNSGILGFSISLSYDADILEPISVIPNDTISGYMNDNIASSGTNSFSVVWFGTDVYADDGILFTATFRLKTSEAVSTRIMTTYSSEDTFDGDYNDVSLACRDIVISTDATTVAEIYANDMTVESGATFSVPVYVHNPSGLTQAAVAFSYDQNVFSFDGVSSDCGTAMAIDGDELTISWNGSLDDSGVLFTIQLKSVADATEKYDFSLACANASFSGSGMVECSAFSVSVRNQQTARVYCEAPVFVPGEDVSVNILIANNPGLMGCTLFVDFDPAVLTFKRVNRKGVISEGSSDYSIRDGRLKLVWYNTDDVISDGVLYELRFGTLADDSYDSTELILSYDENDTFDAHWDSVVFDCESAALYNNNLSITDIAISTLPAKTTYMVGDALNTTGLSLTVIRSDGSVETITRGFVCTPTMLSLVGTQTITVTYRDQTVSFTVSVRDDILPGDINTDGTVDLKDVVLLQRYLSGGWNVIVNETNADVNKDGSINVKDVVLMQRYLAGGWSVTLI